VKRFLFISLVTGIVFSAVAGAAPPYTPSQTTPKVVIETIAGDITIELFPNKAPISVSNFLQYVNSGYYDGLIIHRVVNDANFSIMQGGGFGPGGVYKSEGIRPPIINESSNGLSNLRGTVAMARTQSPNSATSQFYINAANNIVFDRGYQNPNNPGYCVFGQVISDMNVVDRIVQLPTLDPGYVNGLIGCPYYGNYWVYVARQQVRVCVSPAGNDSTGLGSIDSPLKTIQKAIDVVNEPGHVVPAPATYTGAGNVDLDFKGKGITVRAIESFDVNTVTKTVINCQGSPTSLHRGFYFHTGEDANSVLQGLTIINGYQAQGGAIWCNSSPTIKNCTIIKNTASGLGGGIYCYNSDAVISNCTFSKNSASSNGGAIYCGYSSDVILSNSILWNNTASFGHEIALTGTSLPSTLTVSYSDIDGERAETYSEPGCSLVWKPGNIDLYPRFVNADNNDYHLQSQEGQWDETIGWTQGQYTSPCIERGNPGSLINNELLVSANLRIDMGSFGNTIKASKPPADWGLLADIDNDGTTDAFDFACFASYWLTKGSDIPADLDRSEYVDMADLKLLGDDWLRETNALLINAADFNRDGIVNIRDFAILAGQWQQQGLNKTCDLNGDAIVNIGDLDLLTRVWLK
jgi:peptidyl-prolyl cis-trans isomerase A (cyclophilin A)/peptidyl-prolyl cis-trans isomerase B (cyclophilin B)